MTRRGPDEPTFSRSPGLPGVFEATDPFVADFEPYRPQRQPCRHSEKLGNARRDKPPFFGEDIFHEGHSRSRFDFNVGDNRKFTGLPLSKRAEASLTGTNMEIVTSISEIKSGETSTLHFHHGDESYYFLEGGTIELPDGKQVPIPTGAVGLNVRDVPHGAYKVVGDKTVKLLTVYIVDKGKALYDKPPAK